MPIYEFENVRPVVDPTAYIHPLATLIGDVIVGPNCFVGPSASLRGDIGRIELHEGSNVQDNCTLHTFPGKNVIVEANGHIGHGCVLHGCIIKQNALVGMNAVVMDNAVIGESSFVAAMAFVKTGMEVPAKSLVAGIPAKVVRELKDEEIEWKAEGTEVYQELARRYLANAKECEPLRELTDDRPELPVIGYKPKQ